MILKESLLVLLQGPGIIHDDQVLSNSRIISMFRDGALPLLHRSLLPGVGKVPVVLLADPAYTLL